MITGVCGFASADAYDVHFPVKPGPYGVGLKVVEQYDCQRTFGQVGAADKFKDAPDFRPLQTLVWYPAQQSKRPAMTMGDYLALMSTEVSFGKPQQTRDGDVLKAWLQRSLGHSLSAVRDAEPEDGRFPVVVYAPSFSSTPWENADLCEYLASYGYVVLASPGMGKDSSESTHDLAGIAAQAGDVSFLVQYAASLRNTDMTEVAAIGFSWGGLSNLFAASADARIKALVSLDGSERYFPGLVKASGTVYPEQMRIPLLYPEFCSIAYRNSELWEQEFPNLQVADYDRADGIDGYAWVMRYTRAFLDFYLKRDSGAGTFLRNTPGANEVPKHTMSVKFRPATAIGK